MKNSLSKLVITKSIIVSFVNSKQKENRILSTWSCTEF